ncbi:hypothetical protein ABVK25_009924 [Lepraria finkii]|uniref:Pyridoxamine 5'-phosphate oxidase Alr4036 family FMN-binding domain-containing protein n=1 Tax=Lepraria finkii TaxID=1340010 RepID=A0ABR4AVY2_9LECA
MSTTTQHLSTPPAPWKSTFESHISELPSPNSSSHPSTAPSPPAPQPLRPPPPLLHLPRHVGFPPRKQTQRRPRNPPLFDSDMPTFTTDVRMQKVMEIFGSSAGHADRDELIQGSGGGGPVEAVWWVKDTGTQWRIKGDAFVVGRDIDGGGGRVVGVRTVKSEVGRRMREDGG